MTTPGRETCKRLKRAGFPQGGPLYCPNPAGEPESFTAPILTQILDLLPVGTSIDKCRDGYTVYPPLARYRGWYHSDNPAEAAALLWLGIQLGHDHKNNLAT